MSEEEVALVLNSGMIRQLKKGEVLVNEGEECRSFFLVENGYLRNWHNKDGTAINLNFTFEGGFTTNLKSFYTHEPSEFTIEAGEPAIVLIFDFDVIIKKFDADDRIVLFIRRVIAQLLLAYEEHINFYKMYTPTERYRYIEKNNPQLLQRVSLSQLASYLGVKRETLSRIRAKKLSPDSL
jgi:CRP-like cAMP-binding protein